MSKIAHRSNLPQKACLPFTGNGTLKEKIVTKKLLVEEHLLISFNNRFVPLTALSCFLSSFVKFLLNLDFVFLPNQAAKLVFHDRLANYIKRVFL